jgi:hypothetical protein
MYTRAAQHSVEAVQLLATSSKSFGDRLVDAYCFHVGTLAKDEVPTGRATELFAEIKDFFHSREPEYPGEGTAAASVRRRRKATLSAVADKFFEFMLAVAEARNVALF